MPKKERDKGKDPLNVSLPGDFSRRFIKELKEALNDDLLRREWKTQYLEEELFSKYCDPTTTPAKVRQEAAVAKWLSVDSRNSRTNQRLYYMDVDFGWIHSQRLMSEVRSLITRILGPLQYPKCVCDGMHTNGASPRIKRSPAAAIAKLTGEAELSPSALKHWLQFASTTRLSDQRIAMRESSALFTVPKKSDIDRVACKEPEINVLLQKSVGNHIRRRLRKYGQNLNDQTVNQDLARRAVRENLATIDLSSASDSITKQLVINLLPFEWWSLLDDLRVKETVLLDGSVHEMEMFSTMGNGFTFELESLLFYAITRVVCWRSGIKGRISVYGDDIIAPVACVSRLKRVFDYFGFQMNPKKTHSTGYFRESCGKHYHRGLDVSPFYIRREIRKLPDLINILNRLLIWDGRGWGFFTTPSISRFHRKWAASVPSHLHGGIDPEDPSALVTGDPPRQRLVPIMKHMPRPNEVAAQTLWLLAKNQNGSTNPPEGELDWWPLWQPDESQGGNNDVALMLDPQRIVGFRAKPLIHRGARTTWVPYLLEETLK